MGPKYLDFDYFNDYFEIKLVRENTITALVTNQETGFSLFLPQLDISRICKNSLSTVRVSGG